jgi:hypothetical protein
LGAASGGANLTLACVHYSAGLPWMVDLILGIWCLAWPITVAITERER